MTIRKFRKEILAGALFMLGLNVGSPAQEEAGASGTTEQTIRGAQTTHAIHAPNSDGHQEEIKVHGHWTIVIRNPDGSVSSHSEFENALIPTGGGLVTLNLLLAHQAITPAWQVSLIFSGGGNNFRMLMNTGSNNGPIIYSSLKVSAPSSGVNAGKLVLEGSVPSTVQLNGQTTSINGQLNEVTTSLTASCVSGVVPCGGNGSGSGFTDRDLTKAVPPATTPPPPITIQAGQSLDVTVVIGFQ